LSPPIVVRHSVVYAHIAVSVIRCQFAYLGYYRIVPDVRAHLEYAVSVWNLHYQTLIKKLEKVQKRATKLVITIKKLQYEERL